MCDSGGGGDNTNYGFIKQQQADAEKQLAMQQQQWQAAQQASNLASNVQNQGLQKQIDQTNQQTTQQQNNFQAQNLAQGKAANATGGPSGIKAAATVAGDTLSTSPADAKLQAAGLTIPGVDSLTNFLRQRSLSQSNTIGGGNALNSSGVALGG